MTTKDNSPHDSHYNHVSFVSCDYISSLFIFLLKVEMAILFVFHWTLVVTLNSTKLIVSNLGPWSSPWVYHFYTVHVRNKMF